MSGWPPRLSGRAQLHGCVHENLRGLAGPDSRWRPSSTCTSGGIQRGNYLPWHAMTREAVLDSRQEILRTAARLFQQRGYDATSMNDVAAALKFSKGGCITTFKAKTKSCSRS